MLEKHFMLADVVVQVHIYHSHERMTKLIDTPFRTDNIIFDDFTMLKFSPSLSC